MLGFLLTALMLMQPARPEIRGFVVIVNQKNPVQSLPSEVVGEMFLKKVVRWEEWEGQPLVQPVDQRKGSALRSAFSAAVFSQRPSRINTYWQRLIFSGRGAPPLDVGSDEEVMSFVLENPGGIGYVAASTKLITGVKAVAILGESRSDDSRSGSEGKD